MEIESIVIPATNDFASLYMDQKEPVKGFFHYDITENGVYEARYNDLMKRTFNRKALSTCIADYMERFPSSDETRRSLEKLKDDRSTVVIGGQQAGLLTGPLYTIHKIVSIIKLARQQEERLGTPVIPVFWIAGEDHDFLEINHVYAQVGEQMKKVNFPEDNGLTKMASDMIYNKEKMQKWLETVMTHFGERQYTKELLTSLLKASEKSETITDFFSTIIMSLFKDYGLLIIDAANPQLRNIERPFFTQMLEQAPSITSSVLSQQEAITKHGFKRAIEIDKRSANLFLYEEGERLLLNYDPEIRKFITDKTGQQFDAVELFGKLNETPEIFSNNVVTRPLMQESLFPSLAFIGGPGEIAYWGELKQAFELWGMKMPPLVPRITITFLDSAVERDLEELQLPIKDVLIHGTEELQKHFLDTVKNQELEKIIMEMEQYLEERYQTVFKDFAQNDPGLLPLAEKNLAFHKKQFTFLQKKADRQLREKYENELEKYKRIERSLRPNGSPQERIWNIYYYLNERGEQFISQLMAVPIEFDSKHKIIKI